MSSNGRPGVPTWKDQGIALAIFACGVFAAAAPARGDPPARAGAVGAAALLPDPGVWKGTFGSSLRMHPWYPLAFSGVTLGGVRGCGAGTARGGWIMVGAALRLSACCPALAWLS